LADELGHREHEPLHAPELVEPETLHALRRLVGAGNASDRRASEALEDLASTNLRRYPHAPLRERVWELRHELTAYDATYLALAEALGESVLVTSDAALAGRGRSSLGDDRVLHLD
jgi:predicted nucleic acid-binding protein